MLDQPSDGKYEMYRPFHKYVPLIEERGLALLELAKYIESIGAMWIFEKKDLYGSRSSNMRF
jgi:hypothetical protein